MNIFLRSIKPEIQKDFDNLPKLDHEALIKRYEESFKHLSGKEINTDLIIKINSFHNYLKKIEPMLSNFKDIASNMITIKNEHNLR